MSITQTLSNATSGLTASARMAEVASSNISNALTPGYGRRILDLSAQTLGGNGAGVRIDGVTRVSDRGLLAERRIADAQLGGFQMQAGAAARLEALIGGPDDASGIGGRIAALEASLYSAASQPSSDQRLTDVVWSLGTLAQTLNDDAAGLRAERQSADSDIARQVDTLNTALERVQKLNIDVARAQGAGSDASGLIDQRQQTIDQIAQIVPLREVDRANGQVALFTTSGETLIDGPPSTFGFTRTSVIMPHMTHAGGMLGGITRDGVPLGPDGLGKLRGGALEAAFTLRDKTLPDAEQKLDALALDLIERFQNNSVDPSLSAADAGLLTDGGTAHAGPSYVGLAGRITVNTAIDPAQGGQLSRLRDGVAATATGPLGDASQITRFLDALGAQRTPATGGAPGGAAALAGAFASSIGSARLAAEEEQAFATARWSGLREAELAGGVDTDQEMQMLLRIEQNYAANARVIQTVQSMIQRLLEI